MYDLSTVGFLTPRGIAVQLRIRDGTNDYNTANSCLNEDEYELRDLRLSGRALDVGAYIGAVAIALAMDNPDLEVLALEAVPANAELTRQNVKLNGLDDWITVIEGAACKPRQTTAQVHFGYRGSESALHHAFVGNSTLLRDTTAITDHDTVEIACRSLQSFGALDFLKIDCEGCEWDFLRGPARKRGSPTSLDRVKRIHGEWHPTEGRTQADFLALLTPTHEVTFSGPDAGPGGFVAVLR